MKTSSVNYLDFIFQDWGANKNNTKGRIYTLFFRIANYSTQKRAYKILMFPYLIMYKFISEFFLVFELPYSLNVGPGLRLFHCYGLVVNKKSKLGCNVTLRHLTTIGNSGLNEECPIIGDFVDIGTNVCIIGNINIENNVIIGAGSVVVKNLESNSIYAGNPARFIRKVS